MSHKKAGGSTSLGRDSAAQRLGIKVHDGQKISKGMIIIRQRGTRIHAGKNVKRAGDDSLYALVTGKVKFATKKRIRFDGALKNTKFVHVLPLAV